MKNVKRFLSALLVLVLMVGLVPGALASTSFSDVSEGAWYYDAVMWAVEKGITTGVGDGKFAPDNTCTRAQVVTFLWRSQGSPAPAGNDNPFTDVSEGAWYYNSVLWAVENGITTGMSPTSFGPDSPCNRAQVVTFLWRTMGKPAPESDTNPFNDVAAGAYYYDAVLWAVENGITTGMGEGVFAPDNACNRGQIVCFLYRTPEPGLRFATQPKGGEAPYGGTWTLTVAAENGAEPYSYQWKKDGSAISGATGTSYNASEAGTYSCVVTDAEGKEAESNKVQVTIAPPEVEKITLNAEKVTVEPGKSYQLTAEIDPAGAAVRPITWTSSNPAVATVSADGLVQAVAQEGETVITVTCGGMSASCAVRVGDCGVEGISFDSYQKWMTPNSSFRMEATVEPSNAFDPSLTWTSSDESILTVDANGTVRSTGKEGSAEIVATALNGVKETCTVYVCSTAVLYKPDGTPVEVDPSEAEEYVEEGWYPNNSGLNVQEEGTATHGKGTAEWSFGNGYLYAGGTGESPYQGSAPWKAFADEIETVYVKRGITAIGSFGFDEYEALKRIEISDTVTAINSYAFCDCALVRMGIPASVTSIHTKMLDTYSRPAQSSNKNVVIYCEPGSAAETFAIRYNLSYVHATMVYSADGRTCMVTEAEREIYLRNGWYAEPMVTLYAMDGTTKVVPEGEAEQYIGNGWYANRSEILTTVYAVGGATKTVLKIEADKLESEGWYAYPVSVVYAADGTEKVVPTDEIEEYVAQGYYKDKSELYVTMYALDGRTQEVLKINVAAEQAVGWYLYEDYVVALAEKYSYMAGTDFRRVRRQYSSAEAQGAYVVVYVDLNGDLCVLTHVKYKIRSNYSVTTLHNITKGTYIEDPGNYYKTQANRYWGANRIHYMNLSSEAMGKELVAMNAIVSIWRDGTDPGTGCYVTPYTLNL